ncbi:cytochrome P450 [Amycolatopsis rhabdoformis]|uniref:Cytochrome P450 n=1 Tax=Amycolatopsis rhabdoformis TaxID=1448059 RepID=A0ABZ1IK30_9PSEU|nr:cytochrome P450 [Amycolatopsis rhabdoformis]WSE34116.1 cytochrome P450 [Amycolatopsis rhabdoformis]
MRTVVDGKAMQDAHGFLAKLREAAPVCPVSEARQATAVLVTRYEDVRALVGDSRVRHDIRSKAEQEAAAEHRALTPREELMHRAIGISMLYRDPPDHTRLRRLVNRAFTPGAVHRLQPDLSAVIDELIAGFAPDRPVDLVAEFAVPVTTFAICELLGIPQGDRGVFWGWAQAINDAEAGDAYYEALAEAAEYLSALIERKRADPGPDLLSELVAVSDEDGDRLSADELVATSVLLLIAGHDTSVHLIANAVLCLLGAPDQLAEVRADLSLVDNVVEEVLRYESPVNILPPRFAGSAIEVAGGTVPEGETVLLSVLAANRDAAVFPDPDRFDITRPTAGHLAFGHGIHYCPGAPLARLEARLAVAALVTCLPHLRLAVAPDDLRWRDSTLMHGLESLPVRTGP